jgi:hypothetical protein
MVEKYNIYKLIAFSGEGRYTLKPKGSRRSLWQRCQTNYSVPVSQTPDLASGLVSLMLTDFQSSLFKLRSTNLN